MTLNIKKFESDIERLISTAADLELAMLVETHGKPAVKQLVLKGSKPEDVEMVLNNLPSFKTGYEEWYSEARALVKQLLPDRVANFVDHYEAPKGRKELNWTTYRIQDYQQGTRVTQGYNKDLVVDQKAAIPHLQSQAAIVAAARSRLKSSLFEMRQIVQADLFDSEVESARELLKHKFLRAAGAVAGVVLEKHLRQVCEDHNLKIAKKNPTINDLNEMLKAASVIDVPQWRFVSMLADIRNLCDHNKQREPTEVQVSDLIEGTDKILKTIS